MSTLRTIVTIRYTFGKPKWLLTFIIIICWNISKVVNLGYSHLQSKLFGVKVAYLFLICSLFTLNLHIPFMVCTFLMGLGFFKVEFVWVKICLDSDFKNSWFLPYKEYAMISLLSCVLNFCPQMSIFGFHKFLQMQL